MAATGGVGLAPPPSTPPTPTIPSPTTAAPPATGRAGMPAAPAAHAGNHGGGHGAQHPAVQAAAHAAQRAAIANSNPLLGTGILGGSSLLQAAKGLADVQSAGPLELLGRQLSQGNANTAAQEKLIAGYFNQLGQYGQRAVGTEGTLADQLNQRLSGLGAADQQQLSQIGSQAQQSLAALAPGGDQSLMAGGQQQLAQSLARQQGAAASNDSLFAQQGAVQGNDFQQLVNANQGAYMKQGQQDLSQVAQAGQLKDEAVQAKIATEHANYGSTLAADLYKLRQQSIADQNAQAALGIRSQQARTTAAYDGARITATYAGISAADLRAANAQAAENARNRATNQARLSAEQSRVNRAAAKAGKSAVFTATGVKALTTGEQARYFGYINSIKNTLQAYTSSPLQTAAGPVAAGKTPTLAQAKELIAASSSGRNYPQALISAAAELLQQNWLTSNTVHSLNNLGMVIGAKLPRAPANTAGQRRT